MAQGFLLRELILHCEYTGHPSRLMPVTQRGFCFESHFFQHLKLDIQQVYTRLDLPNTALDLLIKAR